LSRRRRLLPALAAFALGSSCATARANGRFPRAERLIEDPTDPNRLTLAATFGLLTTVDRGLHWYFVCEGSFAGSDSYVGDPIFDLSASGAQLVGVQTALNVSRDQGCSWSTALGGPTDSVPDFTVRRQTPGGILALRAVLVDGSVVVRVEESTDDGASWNPVGAPPPLFGAFTIDFAPSSPDTFYVSGTSSAGAGRVAVSTDHGATWTASDLPSSPFQELPYIAAIHPSDPKKVYVRTDAWDTSSGVSQAEDALLYSEDGGQTWRELYRTGAKLLGFALSPDASTALLGYGNPHDPDGQIDDSVTGVYVGGAAGSSAFTRVSAASITGLSWTKTGIYVCSLELGAGYSLAFASDSSFVVDGSGLQPLLRLAQIAGPYSCGAPAAQACAQGWSTTCATFGACRDGGTASPSSDGGADGSVGGAAPEKASGGGGGCRSGGGSQPSPAGADLGRALLALVAVRVIRRTCARKRA
jgi:hypothetical protein